MMVCDVVKNSVWFDPRVTKQLIEYSKHDLELVCVGIYDERYNQEELSKLPCNTVLVGNYNRGKGIIKQALWEYKTNRDLYKTILKLKPDVIHANDLNALIPSCKAAKKLKCRVIYDSHEIFLENLWIARNKYVKAVYRFFEKKLIHRIDLLVCVSNAAKEYLEKQYSINNSIVVTNSIRKETIETTDFQLKSNYFEVLNHGQFYEGRGYDLMVQAAKLLQGKYNDILFVLRGFGSMEKQLKDYVKQNRLPNVQFDPPVKTYQLVSMASRSSIGLAITEPNCINFELSVSNKLFEYAAAGLPVIMSDIPEHRLLNDKYNFGVVLSENTPECISSAIEQIYNDKSLYSELSNNAIRLSEELCWENEFNKILTSEVFSETIRN